MYLLLGAVALIIAIASSALGMHSLLSGFYVSFIVYYALVLATAIGAIFALIEYGYQRGTHVRTAETADNSN